MPTRLAVAFLTFTFTVAGQQPNFITIKDHQLIADGKPYYFVGTNYWYGGLLGLESDKKRGILRLRRELDFLKSNGVTNLRLMAGAEGSGPLNGVARVGAPLQPEQNKFDEGVLYGLDTVLSEMGKRRMRAVIFISNNWEWSGGFQQYLIWNHVIAGDWLIKKPTWDELRDNVAKFYSCKPCTDAYAGQARMILSRTNKINGKPYGEDPTIMSWEIANEPRPMRPSANQAYKKWIAESAAMIKSIDKNHLVTTGHEGWIGTESIGLFEEVHADKNIDYLTIHIWPKNWGWITGGKVDSGFQNATDNSVKYINDNASVAAKLNKPMVIEEFGLPRDGSSFDPASTTKFRDLFFAKVLSFVGSDPYIAGANFWAFGGTARPIKGQPFWQAGDERMGDPPMEEQGLNSVFNSDSETWKVLRAAARR